MSYQPINIGDLESRSKDGETVSLETLKSKGMMRKRTNRAKILAKGKISKKVTIKGLSISATAKDAVEKAGGKVI